MNRRGMLVEESLRVVEAREVKRMESVTRHVAGPLIVVASRLICAWGQCHQDGHWASGESFCSTMNCIILAQFVDKACPNDDAGASKRSRSFGSKADNVPSGPCFKCGQEGHWSNGIYFTVCSCSDCSPTPACPNGGGAPPPAQMASTSRGSKRGRGSTRARGRKSMSRRGGKTKNNNFGAPDD
jgi:hypothetical protein